MKLQSIEIENYKSIRNIKFDIQPVADSFTYTLLGINESGKSSFLNAVSLLDTSNINYPQDYHDESMEVKINLNYKIELDEIKEFKDSLTEFHSFDKKLLQEIEIEEVNITSVYSPSVSRQKISTGTPKFKKSIFEDYTLMEVDKVLRPVKKKDIPFVEGSVEINEDFDLDSFIEQEYEDYFWDLSHKVTFWKSSTEYLILDEIDLQAFAIDPKKTSIPLTNCFKIAGLKDIKKEVNKLNSPVSIQNLEDILSDKITEHINRVWPEHPVRLKFKINNNKLTFLVEDNDVKYKNKTTGQRSDGFRQFISFLLTLSAENFTDELSNSILLLDEPETHLHPNAQINLTNELIKLSKNKNNNIVIFATHSNYMIDKFNMERCFNVTKKNNSTSLTKIEGSHFSYAEVNYEVFDIATNDYHNELYGLIEELDKTKINSLDKNKKWENLKTGKTEDVSLPTYIRHSIHHPENKKNKKFTEAELKKSIQLLKDIKSEL